ncbi:aspartyl/asparaginyl beta-hydroxylase isoform X2 [Zerene cesonia]|uniref:aspartyl/asparaginyl beta-hydroxylase isoform X2 n=1 Tax=Zerene cesonia TaxID=33412 RepID=UPI0018E58CF5|nr:aspartyl/asparaginyl beta-hydroxylase isoform X2 [Zerene cesonia]
MSGDVQPRKRKDKKKKKDELGIEEPRGTAAALGEGDVFLHSHHDHGTGGHWCAKIIFFSLLAVLITLIGLIILENRGLSELEANSVESRYSGVLEGWIEDTPDDDHHDEHTLELKHPVEGNESDDDDDDDEIVEKIEREISDEDIISAEVSNMPETKEDGDNDVDDASKEVREDKEDATEDDNDDDDEDEPPVERITIPPAGKPYTEIEEEPLQSTPDTLAAEEEYEKQQEELRREREAQASQGMWLKLVVGGALLVATHAVVRRATARRDEPENDEQILREDPPVIDRRMTLIPPTAETKQIIPPIQEEIVQKTAPAEQSIPILKRDLEDKNVEIKKNVKEDIQEHDKDKGNEKELYSDDGEEEEEEEIDEEEEEEEEEKEVKEEVFTKKVEAKESKSAVVAKAPPQVEPDEPDSEDVEIIDEEQIEEELEEEEEEDEVEEEISDVDDTELLSRLEAKYGRLPEPERPGKNKGGGNSIEDDWPGEPNDPYWSQQLDLAEDELRQGALSACERRVSAKELQNSTRGQWLAARALDMMAEAKRDNKLLSRAIAAYLQLLKMNERLSDKRLLDIAQRAIDRIQFRGTYLNAEPVYRLLIRRFPNDVHYRNNLTICFLMANRADLADEVLKETIRMWPNDRVALAHYGFVLKTQYNKLEEAIVFLQKALDGDTGPACEPRFYYHLGDALLLLQRFDEANEVHKRGARLGHFLSPTQRSLYNVPRLKGQPWWSISETPYAKLALALEKSWREILKEGLAAKTLYEKEKEGLKERGEWSQLDIFVRGREIPGRCKKAPVTCSIVQQEAAASGCRRGQIKFSLIEPGTHVRPHVGPTNCRLRMHLGLSNTKDTFIRVDKETRQWEVGKVFIFDDSFEHEVWHNGTGSRLVLIVDVWHPDLTPAERRSLPAI